MSDAKKTAGASLGLAGMAGIAGTIISFCTTPAFTGVAGLGMAALVGLGTWLGGTLLAFPAAVAGAIAGGLVGGVLGTVGLLVRKPKTILVVGALGAASGLVIGALGGVAGGSFFGYKLTRDALVEKTSQPTFNNAAEKSPEKPTIAPQTLPTPGLQ